MFCRRHHVTLHLHLEWFSQFSNPAYVSSISQRRLFSVKGRLSLKRAACPKSIRQHPLSAHLGIIATQIRDERVTLQAIIKRWEAHEGFRESEVLRSMVKNLTANEKSLKELREQWCKDTQSEIAREEQAQKTPEVKLDFRETANVMIALGVSQAAKHVAITIDRGRRIQRTFQNLVTTAETPNIPSWRTWESWKAFIGSMMEVGMSPNQATLTPSDVIRSIPQDEIESEEMKNMEAKHPDWKKIKQSWHYVTKQPEGKSADVEWDKFMKNAQYTRIAARAQLEWMAEMQKMNSPHGQRETRKGIDRLEKAHSTVMAENVTRRTKYLQEEDQFPSSRSLTFNKLGGNSPDQNSISSLDETPNFQSPQEYKIPRFGNSANENAHVEVPSNPILDDWYLDTTQRRKYYLRNPIPLFRADRGRGEALAKMSKSVLWKLKTSTSTFGPDRTMSLLRSELASSENSDGDEARFRGLPPSGKEKKKKNEKPEHHWMTRGVIEKSQRRRS